MPLSRRQKRWYWLLVIPWATIFWVASYNRVEPSLFGVPFFYWYQLLWVVLSSVLIAVVFHRAHLRKTPDEIAAQSPRKPFDPSPKNRSLH